MNWLEIQESLNNLSARYMELEANNTFLEKEENYETKNQIVNIGVFYLVKAIKDKVKQMPVSDEEVRKQIMAFGSDVNSISDYLRNLSNDFETYETGMEIVKTLIEISDKQYDFQGDIKDSLLFRQRIDFHTKALEMMDRNDLTLEQKYDYIDSFDKTLSEEEQGELHIQSIIGNIENAVVQTAVAPMLMKAFKLDVRKYDAFAQFIIEVGSVGENRLNDEPLEKQVSDYKSILVSPFVKAMKHDVKNK